MGKLPETDTHNRHPGALAVHRIATNLSAIAKVLSVRDAAS
jgi:hypothetical protein